LSNRLSKTEVEDGKDLFRYQGWLASTVPPFCEAVLSECQWHKVEAGAPISRGGDAIGGIYGVARGSVGIIPALGTSDAGLIHIDRAPFWYGLQPFLTGEGRQVTVLARSECNTAHVSQSALARVLAEQPVGWQMLLIQQVALNAMSIQAISDLLLPDRDRRCAGVLLRVAGARNLGSSHHLEAPEVHCTHEELAAMCNLSRQTVNDVLKGFERRGMIELGYRAITLLDAERLRSLVEDS
jgi:CRP/FNR family cyclic AMP-dependent transcriptional regulator